MTYEICPKFQTCPLYNEQITLYSEDTLSIYKRNYCLAGKDAYTKCRRYIYSEITGEVTPIFVLPNSTLSIEQIKQRAQEEQERDKA